MKWLALAACLALAGCGKLIVREPDPCAQAYMAYKQQLEITLACTQIAACRLTPADLQALKLAEAQALTQCPFQVPKRP